MPNPNAFVAQQIRVDGEAVELAGDRGERRLRAAPAIARLLENIGAQRLPVYVETDPDGDTVARVLIPKIGRVVQMEPRGEGLGVLLDSSHAVHTVRPDDDAAEFEAVLRQSLDSGEPVMLTAGDGGEILDVRGFTPGPDGWEPPFPKLPWPEKPDWRPPRRPPLNLDPLLDLLKRCPSATKAQAVFDDLATRMCNPLTVPPPCIPFNYPDDGCWARAHEMCRLLIDMGFKPGKVWIRSGPGASLVAATRNHPNCQVVWGWHVAPTLCVRGPSLLKMQKMVMDPSLFTTPVTPDQWKGVQGDPTATLTYSGADQFGLYGGTDPNYTSTNATLTQYRLALQARATSSVGPPPYANCP